MISNCSRGYHYLQYLTSSTKLHTIALCCLLKSFIGVLRFLMDMEIFAPVRAVQCQKKKKKKKGKRKSRKRLTPRFYHWHRVLMILRSLTWACPTRIPSSFRRVFLSSRSLIQMIVRRLAFLMMFLPKSWMLTCVITFLIRGEFPLLCVPGV